jgi:hypothetical protein
LKWGSNRRRFAAATRALVASPSSAYAIARKAAPGPMARRTQTVPRLQRPWREVCRESGSFPSPTEPRRRRPPPPPSVHGARYVCQEVNPKRRNARKISQIALRWPCSGLGTRPTSYWFIYRLTISLHDAIKRSQRSPSSRLTESKVRFAYSGHRNSISASGIEHGCKGAQGSWTPKAT